MDKRMNLYNFLYNGRGNQADIEAKEERPPGVRLFFVTAQQYWREIILLNILFILSCIPIITIPAALKAASGTSFRYLMGDPVVWLSDYWALFKRNFLYTTLLGLAWMLLLFGSGFSLSFYGSLIIGGRVFFIIGGLISVLTILMLFGMGLYLFPMMAMTDLPPRTMIKNAFCLAGLRILWTVLVLLLFAAIGAVYLFLYPISTIFLVLFGFSLPILIGTFCAYAGLWKYVLVSKKAKEIVE